ncbi:NAD(P)/FAD-dependent oxidoreductase [Arcobacter sp. FWKO B]|uniref:NAD(P)/FAD-dependent oxidoreductase n=1 Tax=Arcobacter sp. FWKO B TaxID=2593672 RepID=UPI0018A6A7EF|nr:aminoacetone oxidase family FAD-binding enzyme [Arcobacter sp. FWKO B]QOG12116.1 aminoacetone oxidase family FAD-binding enzyme [Arcobacter sp. FWKO B]
MIFNTAIIGAGASGMACAMRLNSTDTAILEVNETIAKKVAISGGGKCNITNRYMDSSHFLGNNDFIKNALKKFNEKDLLNTLKKNNIEPILNPKIVKGTYFCKSSKEILEFYAKNTTKCKKLLNQKVIDVDYIDEFFVIKTNTSMVKTKNLIVASGGLSYPSLGSSDIGFYIAKKFNHPIKTLQPALVGFTVQKEQFWFKDLSGLSIDVRISLKDKTLEGSLLFAHKGISGPVVLSSSLYWDKGQISVDFMPHHSIKKFIHSKQTISNALPLPKRFISSFLKSIKLEDKPLSSLSKDEITLLSTIHNYSFAPAGNFGYTKAEVTKGGVDTAYIDENMQSTLQKGLYFIGEVLDVTGELGGYNLQWAITSGYICGSHINKTL